MMYTPEDVICLSNLFSQFRDSLSSKYHFDTQTFKKF